MSTVFFFFFLILNSCYAFDAGFLDLKPSVRKDEDTTHYEITVCALCRVTIDYLQSVYKIDTKYLEVKFNVTNGQCDKNLVYDIVSILTNSQQTGVNPWQYATTIRTIASSNTKTDLKEVFKSESHFDSETFLGGSKLVMKRYEATVDSVLKADDYDQARKTFGEMLHTLQDFYSHSNYIELEYTSPSDVLGQRLFQKEEYASVDMRTCISCQGVDCQTKPNLDVNILKNKLLTTGYFIPKGLGTIIGKKPKGKCSHGGFFDGSATNEPIGGINKDKLDSVHGHLHYQAAEMAYKATRKILNEFRQVIGDEAFGLFLTLKKNLNSLIISIDTACSMADYTELAKEISINIVKQYGQLEYAPHNYILITFNSDKAEIMVNSRNPNDLTIAIQNLKTCEKKNSTDGELYYHSLVEGLKQCEYASVIYTFTDSIAKDAYLKHQVRALLRNKRAVVYSFMGEQIKRRIFNKIDPLDENNNDFDFASISGGLTFPININDRIVISEFILRRLEWTRLQTIFISKSKSISTRFYVDSSINELYLDISSMGEIKNINQIQLRKPDNSLYILTDNVIHSKHLYMWKILQPNVGVWSLITGNLSQEFDYDIQIHSKTNRICSSTLQKQFESDKDSNGYTQLTTEPLLDSNLIILTTCENVQYSNVTISLIDQFGYIIRNYLPFQSDQLGILTNIRIPQQQFRIQTIITLINGEQIQRIEKQLISPTIFTIELNDQPYIISQGETIQMNYTIKSALSNRVTVRLQIIDTLKIISNDGIIKDLTFINQTSGMNLITLSKDYKEKLITDLVIFTITTQDNQTNKYSYENDEIVSVYLETNLASTRKTINYLTISFLLLNLVLKETNH
ncbi:unnamed protein product [Adineta steineri]|uniref:VWFA domain-containing protein n=1 Tax=Adineta steineri TaxID=433720 RepID=A0A815GHI8_9BILA|nr:unnamed protein product [Adineta steineri]CAF1338930.1 unnamed protein product [Adineta steineri]CAF1347812.1 unnamed protein product [Adineta steineri]